jgi:hypothetical protein
MGEEPKKTPLESGVYTGYCCCREFGFWLSGAVVVFSSSCFACAASTSASACCSSSCVRLLASMSGYRCRTRLPLVETFLVRSCFAARVMPKMANAI